MKKFFSTLLLLIVILVAALFVAKDLVIKVAAETAVTAVTGFKTEIGYLKYQFPSTLEIRDLKILNPQGFEQPVFTQIPEIFVSVNLKQILKGQAIHLPEIRFALQEVNLEKNKAGVSNISLLSSAAQKGQGTAGPKQPAGPAKQGKAMPFQLDRFELTIRNIRYQDRSMVVPVNLVTDLKVEKQVFENITDPQALVNLILLKIVNGTSFGNLGISPDLLQNGLTGAMSSGQDLLKGTTAQMAGEGKALLEGTASGAASSAKSSVAGLFGKVKAAVSTGEKTQ